jgi:endonuclease I/methionine-rich copper-binding protein CopC
MSALLALSKPYSGFFLSLGGCLSPICRFSLLGCATFQNWHAPMRIRLTPFFILPLLFCVDASADTTPQSPPASQNWGNIGLISVNNDWASVPGIAGYLGDIAATSNTGVDPRTILGDSTNTLNVVANQTVPSPTASGGAAEFELTDPVVAIKGSGTADAPYLLISINNSGGSATRLAFNLRDLDGTATDAVQPINVQYRLATSGAFTNVVGGYFPDVTTINATPSTAVDLTLPFETNNQPIVQVRIMTTNAAGNDEWVGIDDITLGAGVDVPPVVASTVPTAGATGVAAGANVTVNFSEPVSVTGSWYTLNCANSGAHPASVSGGPASYVLDPSTDFGFGESCTISITAANVIDLDGTPNPMAANFSASFSTGADVPPTVQSTIPANAATNVSVASNVSINFSEPVSVTGTWYTLSCTASGNNLAATQSGGPQNFVLNPNSDFQNSDSCTLTIIAANVLDQDGTPNAMASNVIVSFQTAPNASNYYASVIASNPAILRTTLHNRIKDSSCYFYSGPTTGINVWTILEKADESPTDNTKVLDVYKNELYTKISDRAGTNPNAATSYNREHTWPNSHGFNDVLTQSVGGVVYANCPYVDTHMLYASNVSYNSSRGNSVYDNCSGCTELATVANFGVGGGSGTYPGNSNWYNASAFETWNRRKGDVARAVLYMDIRYDGGVHGVTGVPEPDLIVTDNVALVTTSPSGQFVTTGYMGKLSTLLAWNQLDPPDAAELARNEVIYSFQGNRNPFIDRPEYAACLYANICGALPELIFSNGFE